jgi:hypothetical protein
MDQINGQLRDIDQQMQNTGRGQGRMQRDNTAGPAGRQGPEADMRQGRSTELQRIRQREAEVRSVLGNLEDQDSEEANDLRQELNRLRIRREAMDRSLQGNAPAEGRPQGQLPEAEGPRQPQQQPGGETATRVYRLKYANAEQLQKILRPLLSRSGQITADERTNSLIVVDAPEAHGRIEQVIRELDVQGPAGREGTQSEDLRGQVRALKEQIQRMQAALDQMAAQKGKDRPQQQDVRKY